MIVQPAVSECPQRYGHHGAPDESLSIEPWLMLLLRVLCRDGVNQMRCLAEITT